MKCIICHNDYFRETGPLINICDACLIKPSEPEFYIKKNGLFIPNEKSKSTNTSGNF